MPQGLSDQVSSLVSIAGDSAGLQGVRKAARALRQPLSLIIGPTQLLLERSAPDDPNRDDLVRIIKNCEILLTRVDELYIAVRAASKARVGFKQTGRILARNLAALVESNELARPARRELSARGYRVLVVDDSVDSRLFISAVLGPFAQTDCVASTAEALTKLRSKVTYDVVVSNAEIAAVGDGDLARTIRGDSALLDTGIFLLTGRSDPTFRAAVIHDTIDDYLSKPFDVNELTARVLRLARDSRARARLRRRALTDVLTDLPNRAAVVERMEHHVRHRTKNLSVILFDIDNFKHVNDTWGHAVGDAVLRNFAKALAGRGDSLRLAARFGGEEFVLLLPETAAADALDVARSFVAEIAAGPIATKAGDLPITTSAGVATLNADDVDWTTLLARADLCLYRAKDEGRNRACGVVVSVEA